MTSRIETPGRTIPLINHNNNFMHYGYIYCKVIGASKYIFNFKNLICTKITFIMLNNIKPSKRFRLIRAVSQCHVTLPADVIVIRITKQIVTGVSGQWWGLFPLVGGISPACLRHLGDIPTTSGNKPHHWPRCQSLFVYYYTCILVWQIIHSCCSKCAVYQLQKVDRKANNGICWIPPLHRLNQS